MKTTNAKRLILLVMAAVLLCSFFGGCATGTGETTPSTEPQITENQATEATEPVEETSRLEKIYDPAAGEGKFSVYYINGIKEYVTYDTVAHSGDATLLVAPDGTTMLLDANNLANGSEIAAALQRLGITSLDYFVFSHPHSDHIGSYATVLRYVDVKQVIMNGHDYSDSSCLYISLMRDLEEAGINITRLKEGDTFMFGEEIEVTVMNPSEDYEFSAETATANSGSLLMRFVYGESSFLFGGDIYAAHERELVEKYGDALRSDVVKMNHHGYDTSNCRDWVQAVDAKIAVGLSHAVMSDLVEGRYRVSGAVTLYSGVDGTICVRTTGDGTYEVQVENERFMDSYGLLTEQEGYQDGYFVVK